MTARLLLAGLLAAWVGCGKPSASSPPPTADRAESVATQATVAAPAPEVATAPPDEAQIAALLNGLTQTVRRYGMEQRRVPKTLDELVTAGYLVRVPQPPAGKKFAIGKDLQVQLANQ